MAHQCDICSIKLDQHDLASHLLGKKHLKRAAAENMKKELIETSIYVSRLPPGSRVPDVVGFFKQFGAIERCKLESSFAIVKFEKHEAVDFLLSRPIWMGHNKLEIKRRRLHEDRSQTKNLPDGEKSPTEIVFAELKTRLQSETTFDGELSAFQETVQLNEEEVEKNWKLLHASLVEVLQPAFPNCEISRFGSSVTGLGFKGSDFDIYLDIGEPIYEEEEKRPGWTPRSLFKEVKILMYRKSRTIFEQIVPIPKAKTPIIKFCHAPTTTSCDLSFKNGLGVINSQLIKQLLGVDVRLKPLMLIIKYHAKTFELSGCGKFTNYAIVMLVVFYLQQPDVRLLPPIAELRKTCEPIYRWNWQVNFDRNFVFPPTTNTSSLTELLQGFFRFYNDFAFDQSMISPLEGRAHSRADLAKIHAERGEDANYLSLQRPVCVQDPIELDNNITAGVSAKVLETFKSFCALGVEVCQAALQNPGKPYLLNLYTTLPQPLKQQAFRDIVISARKSVENRENFTMNNWYAIVQRLCEETLRRVFKLNVQQIKNDRETKQPKIAATSDVHSNDNDRIVLECTGSHNVIVGRKLKGFCIDPTLSPIDKEALISDELVNKQQRENDARSSKIDATCVVLREANPTRLVLRFSDRNSAKKQFRQLVPFLETKLPSIVDKELMHMLQYNNR